MNAFVVVCLAISIGCSVGGDEHDAGEASSTTSPVPLAEPSIEPSIEPDGSAAAAILEVIRRSDIAVRLRVTASKAFEDDEGGISTRYPVEILTIVKSVSKHELAATELVVAQGELGTRVTTSPHEPRLVVGAEYLLLWNVDARKSVSRLESRQVIPWSDDTLLHDAGRVAWRDAIAGLSQLGADVGGAR